MGLTVKILPVKGGEMGSTPICALLREKRDRGCRGWTKILARLLDVTKK